MDRAFPGVWPRGKREGGVDAAARETTASRASWEPQLRSWALSWIGEGWEGRYVC